MDGPADHFATHDTRYKSVNTAFCKGVVVIDIYDGDESGTAPTRISMGDVFVKEEPFSTPNNQPPARRCNECGQLGHLQAQCPRRACKKCGQLGHLQAQCPRKSCHSCGQEGHQASSCPVPSTCGACGGEGHIRKDCKQVCRRCRQSDHAVEDCTSHEVVADLPASAAVASAAAVPGTPGTASSDGEAPTDATAVENHGPPLQQFAPPEPGQIEVKLCTTTNEQHISSIELHIMTSYANENTASGYSHKGAILRMHSLNVSSITFDEISLDPATEENNPDRERLSDGTMEKLTQLVGKSNSTSICCRVQWELQARMHETTGLPTDHLGRGLFSDGTYGPHTATMHLLRDALQKGQLVKFYFYAAAASSFLSSLDEACSSIEVQRNEETLEAWYPRGKPVIQLGMQLKPELRPNYLIPARHQFDSDLEYFTIFYYSLVSDFEAVPSAVFVEADVRLVEIGPNPDQRTYFALIVMNEDLRLRVDASFEIQFLGADEDDSKAWRGRVVPSVGLSNGLEHAAFIRRPYYGREGFEIQPQFAEHHVIKASGFNGADALRSGLDDHPGVRVYIRVGEPKNELKREIDTLAELFRHKDGKHQKTVDFLLNNNLLNHAPWDYFAKHVDAFGRDVVQSAVTQATKATGLNDKQLDFFDLLKSLRGGVGLVQGPGGTGKSRLILALIAYHYELYAHGHDAGQVWVTSPLNAQLDDLCVQAYQLLMERYTVLCQQSTDKPIPPPIVIRRHMRETDRKVWKHEALSKRREQNVDTRPNYTPDLDDAAVNEEDREDMLASLAVQYRLRAAFVAQENSFDDDRMKQIAVSEGQWMLHLAGVPMEDGQLHPIANPDAEKYSLFRHLLEKFSQAHKMGSDMETLHAAANALAADLAQMGHAIFMTPHTLSEHRTHTTSSPYSILHDEAGKTSERASLHSFAWVKPDTFRVMFGDTFQPAPVVGPAGPSQTTLFYEQGRLSLFARLIVGGASQLWLDLQHRFVPAVADLVNAILPGEQLRTDPAVCDLPAYAQAKAMFEKSVGLSDTLCYLQTRGDVQSNPVTQSSYNVPFAMRCISLAARILGDGFKGQDIGIVTPYTAQRDLYIAGVHIVANFLNARGSDTTKVLAKELLNVAICTVDGIQGAQKNLVILDTTVAGNLGFMRDTSRILLAISRPRFGLFIIGDSQACFDAARNKPLYKKTAYYKMTSYCQDKKCYINLDKPRDDKEKEAWRKLYLPIDLDERLSSVHAKQTNTKTPYDLKVVSNRKTPDMSLLDEIFGFGGSETGGDNPDNDHSSGEAWGGGSGSGNGNSRADGDGKGNGWADGDGKGNGWAEGDGKGNGWADGDGKGDSWADSDGKGGGW